MKGASMIGGIGEGVTGIVQAIVGSRQYKKNKEKLDELLANRPDYDIPEGYFSNVELAQQQASRTRLPGQSLYEQQIGSRTASGIRQSREAATSSGDLLAATSNLYGQETDALTNLQIQAAQQQTQGEANLMSARNTLSAQQEKKYNWEVAVPYQTRINQYAKSAQAGFNTWVGGANRIGSSFQTFAGGQGEGSGNVQQGFDMQSGGGWSPQGSGNYGSLSQYNQASGQYGSLSNWKASQSQGGFSNPSLNAGGLNF